MRTPAFHPHGQPVVGWAPHSKKFVYFPSSTGWECKTLMLYAPATGRA